MGDANKEAFEARLAASKSKHERELAAWRANGGDAFDDEGGACSGFQIFNWGKRDLEFEKRHQNQERK